MRKITIVGAGSVGATIAYTLSGRDIASEIVLIDINQHKAEGEVMDIMQGTSFRDPITVRAGGFEDAAGSDIVIVTSGVARKPGQTRLELTQTNVDIIKQITPPLVKAAPDAIYIIVSNPVDIITYVFTKISGLPENHIIGSGTILDTSRLRFALSEHYKVAQTNVHAYVFGEHGDSSFVLWSSALVSSVPLEQYASVMRAAGQELPEPNRAYIEEYIHKSGGRIIADKGATFYAVSVAVCQLCTLVMSSYPSIVTVSSMLHGEYGLNDVCLSMLAMVGPKGLQSKVPIPLNESEQQKLWKSAGILQDIIRQIKI